MTYFRWGRLCLALLGAAWLAAPAGAAVQQQVAQLDRPRFMRPVPGRRAAEEIDVTREPILRRRIVLDRAGATVAELLQSITRQTGLRFAYNADALPADRVVELQATSITVAAALTEILVDVGVDVLFKSPSQAVLVPRRAAWPAGTVVGRVLDGKTKDGIAGAEVFLQDTRWRTVTDSGGRYRLTDVDSGSYSLNVRRPGYRRTGQRVLIGAAPEDTVDVVLEPAVAKLEELVTTATGQQRRRDLGNAITTIRADSIMQHAVIRNLTDLLQDRVPGLTVQHTTGAPGDPAKLRLRGLGSAFRSNDPVVIVDGVRIYAVQSEARSGNLTNALSGQLPLVDGGQSNAVRGAVPAPSPLDQIDPNIIETIEVFKGPSAATLYGADAANGVIVITTKRGKPGPARWTAHLEYGRTATPGRFPEGYYRWGHDSLDSSRRFCMLTDFLCVQDSLTRFQLLSQPDLTVLGQGRLAGLSLTASGGMSALTYAVTGSYRDETGLLKLPGFEIERFDSLHNRATPDWMQRPQRYKTWSVTSNVHANLSATADVTLSTSLTRSEQQRSSLESQLTALLGTYLDRVNGLYYRPLGNSFQATAEILRDYYVRTTASTTTITTGLAATWRPRSWFAATGNAGLNITPRNDQLFLAAGLVSPTDSGAIVRGSGRSVQSSANVQGELRKPLGRGFVFATSLGANLTTTTTSDLTSRAEGLIPGTSSINGARQVFAMDGEGNTSVFGWYVEPRITGQRLSLSTGLRLDGGSAYGARITRTGGGGGLLRSLLSLPKLNGSWVISEEPWFPFTGFFSSLRLRGAYGQAQVQPGPIDRLRIYSRAPDEGGILTLVNIGNTHLKPERSTEIEAGFEADVLDSRLSLDVTAYRKMQVDALMPLTLPLSINGGGSVMTNIGNIKNTGLEFTVGITPVQWPALKWGAQLTYSRNNNVLTKLGASVKPNPRDGLVEGYPVHSRWALPILGFADENGNGVLERREIQVGDSMVYMGRLQPAYQTTLHTNVELFGGAVGVAASFHYDAGASQVDQTAQTNWVLARAMADPSAPLREQAAVLAFQELGFQGAASPATDYGLIQTVSTFRFRSLSVRYNVPAAVARLFRAQQVAVAVQGDNLGLHSTYRGKDPDVNSWSPGESIVDAGQLPQPRTWQLRVDLQY